MPEVLTGSQPGLSFGELHLLLCDDLGYKPENTRFKNKVLRWANSTIRQIQLKDPQNRRTVVVDAEWTAKAGQAEYRVRDSTDSGGLEFNNLYEIKSISIPGLSDYPLELIGTGAFDRRGRDSNAGTTCTAVLIDKYRFRLDPVPDQDYAAKMDFYQLIPQLTTAAESRVEWPETWDEVLKEGTKAEAYKVAHKEFPAVWKMQLDLFNDLLEELRAGEQATHERPRQVVVTRNLRQRVFRDNSADYRRR